MKRKTKKWLKKQLNLYNLAILGAVILIIVAIVFIVKPTEEKNIDNNSAKDNTNQSINQNTTQNTNTPINNDIVIVDENEARTIAVNKFKELGETIEKDKLNVVEIERNGQKCYFISSRDNTMEVSMSTGKITRLNSIAQ